MDGSTSLTSAVARARGRYLANQAVSEATGGLAIALLGPTVLLLLGWNWFAWPLLAGFALGGAGLAAVRLWRGRPSPYGVSQLLDVRLASRDQISTAIYFLDAAEPTAVEQRRAAAAIAARSNPEEVFPFTWPRSATGLAGVFLLASLLFAVRYWLEKPLSLAQPLSALLLEAMNGPEGREAQRVARAEQNRRAAALEDQDQNGRPDPEGKREPGSKGAPEAAENGPMNPSDQENPDPNAAGGEEPGDLMAASDFDQPIQSYEDMLERDAQSGVSKQEGKQGKDGNAKGEPKESPNGESAADSLMAKLQEAFRNMMSKLQQKAPRGEGQQMAAAGSMGEGAEQKEGKGEGQSGAGQAKGDGKNASEGEASGQGSEAGDPKSTGKDGNADGGARGESGQGAGSQEGDKAIREALQLQAMGELSELYGRRAANVAGEITIEAQAGKQTLRTPLTARAAQHGDSGGAVSRDEIPLAYQAYVKEYFQKIRQASQK